jgi:putative nucleotidyltransferase with HDIG domain
MTVLLGAEGYRTVCAGDGREALDAIDREHPQLIIADIKMPVMNGIQLLIEIRTKAITTPVIMTTGFPDLDSALQAMQNGATDYIIKPYQPGILIQKIRQALTSFSLKSENILLSRLVSLHEITRALSGIHDLEELLGFFLDSCLRILAAQGGSIQLYDKEHDTLTIVRERGIQSPRKSSPMSAQNEWAISKWVIRNGQSVLICNGRTIPEVQVSLDRQDICSALSVPLKTAENVIGVVNLNRDRNKAAFGDVDMNIIEILASQAGIAISNAQLYQSLNQKIDELSLIGQYAEDLMTHVDRMDVIHSLFETVHKHFPVDIIGFLLPLKRTHEFLYWSRGQLGHDDAARVCGDAVDSYNRISGAAIPMKRVKINKIALSGNGATGTTSLPYAFLHSIPLKLDTDYFGLAVFGSSLEPHDRNGMISILQNLVNQTRIALANTKLYDDVKENYIRTIKALAIAVDAKDTYTHGHSENVMKISEAIALEMQIGEKQVGIIRDAGLLHDIGKIGIPGKILNKPGPLTYLEFNDVMKTHSMLGANIVKDVPFLRDLYFLILYHHENFDGTGYPDGFNGEKIPLGARILHVADAFEAMTSNRPYRVSLGRKEALRRLSEQKGKQFDPEVVDAFIKVARKNGWIE